MELKPLKFLITVILVLMICDLALIAVAVVNMVRVH